MRYFLYFLLFSLGFASDQFYKGANNTTVQYVEQFKAGMLNKEASCFFSRAYSGEDPLILDAQDKIESCLRYTGIRTIYDTNAENGGLSVGEDVIAFMESNIKKSSFVIAFYTPTFLERSKMIGTGVAREYHLILERINIDKNIRFFIPILAKGASAESIPLDFRSALYIDAVKNGVFNTDSCIIEILNVLKNRITSFGPSSDQPAEDATKSVVSASAAVVSSDISAANLRVESIQKQGESVPIDIAVDKLLKKIKEMPTVKPEKPADCFNAFTEICLHTKEKEQNENEPSLDEKVLDFLDTWNRMNDAQKKECAETFSTMAENQYNSWKMRSMEKYISLVYPDTWTDVKIGFEDDSTTIYAMYTLRDMKKTFDKYGNGRGAPLIALKTSQRELSSANSTLHYQVTFARNYQGSYAHRVVNLFLDRNEGVDSHHEISAKEMGDAFEAAEKAALQATQKPAKRMKVSFD